MYLCMYLMKIFWVYRAEKYKGKIINTNRFYLHEKAGCNTRYFYVVSRYTCIWDKVEKGPVSALPITLASMLHQTYFS